MKQSGKLFYEHMGIVSTKELKEAGFYSAKIRKMVDEGNLIKICRGYYRYEDSYSDLPLIVKLFPDAVICMESALDYYGYTDRTPSAWNLAVDNKSSRTRFYIDDPIIKPHFVKTERYSAGIENVEIDGVTVKIYDRDKTICDLFLHRKKVDAEVFNTAVQRYINDSLKNEARLMYYARLLHVERKVREALEIWL